MLPLAQGSIEHSIVQTSASTSWAQFSTRGRSTSQVGHFTQQIAYSESGCSFLKNAIPALSEGCSGEWR